MELNENLRSLRKTTGKQMKDVAHECLITPENLGRYERNNNEPNIATLIILADYYHVSIDYLLRRNDNISIPKEEYKELKDTKTLYDKVINDLSKVIHERDRI